jgi:hypothetical protein
VLKLTDDLKVKVVAGTPLHCHVTTGSSSSDHNQHSKQRSDGNNSDNISGAGASTFKVCEVSFSSCHQIACFKAMEGLHTHTHPPLTAWLYVTSTALVTLLFSKIQAVFTCLGSTVCVATLYYFAVALKHAMATIIFTAKIFLA